MLLVAKNIISDSNLFFYLYNFSQSTTFEYNSYNFLTADSDFLKIIENVDKKKAAKIRSEIEKWKII